LAVGDIERFEQQQESDALREAELFRNARIDSRDGVGLDRTTLQKGSDVRSAKAVEVPGEGGPGSFQ
jgi:hypothetical protein